MTEERRREDAFDEVVRAWAARRRADTPPAPADRVWERLEPAVGDAVRRAGARRRARIWVQRVAGAAAILAIGVAIGLGIGRARGGSRATGGPGVAAARPDAPRTVPTAAPRRLPRGQRAYAAATHDHLVRGGALVDAFVRAGTDDRALDERLFADARALLVTTRLLLDAPGADSAQLRPLLDDLELTLARILQLRAEGSAGERALVERALRRREILPRIRSATAAAQGRGRRDQ